MGVSRGGNVLDVSVFKRQLVISCSSAKFKANIQRDKRDTRLMADDGRQTLVQVAQLKHFRIR